MAVLENEEVISDQGFEKKIDIGGMGIAMDILQKSQYQKPIPSTIREIASNGVDSHREREMVKEILTGQKTIEDYYVQREGEVYEASKFNPSYYDLNWLSDEKNIKIEYFERDEEERDLLRFTDFGVGLGGKRLEGFFSLSYSTKRLNKSALGKFGIGAKAPLSTGVDSYRVTSNYNGEKFIFDIYNRKIESVVNSFNDNDNLINLKHQFSEATGNYIYYGEPTDEKNGLVVEVEIKKHQRYNVKEAVMNQLLYFDSVEFIIHHQSWDEVVPVMTKIFYESDDFILSDNRLFTRPHIVLGNQGAQVNYGLIDFDELELNPRVGNIGIKVNNEDIEITPSRESVIWSPRTREVVLKKFQLALEEANKVVSQEMQDDDFLSWLGKNVTLFTNGTNTNPVLKQLAGMIDKTEIESTYLLNPEVKYDSFKKMVGSNSKLRIISLGSKYIKKAYKIKIQRLEITTWGQANMAQLWFSHNSAEERKDAYIIQEKVKTEGSYNDNFTLIQIPLLTDKDWAEEEGDIIQTEVQYAKDLRAGKFNLSNNEPLTFEKILELADKKIGEKKAEYQKSIEFLELAKKSKLYNDYDSLIVPEDWVADILTDQDLEDDFYENTDLPDQTLGNRKSAIDHAKRRKENNKLFLKYLTVNVGDPSYSKPIMKFSQLEDDASELNHFDGTLVYTTSPSKEEIEELGTDQFDYSAPLLPDGTYPIKKVLMGNEPTDENLLKMVGGLLLGETNSVLPSDYNDYANSDEKPDRSGFKVRQKEIALYPTSRFSTYLYSKPIGTQDLSLVKISKSLIKKLPTAIPIKEFMFQESNGILTTHPKIMSWYTAKRISKLIKEIPFLRNFKEISSFHAKEWKELNDFVNKFNFNSFDQLRDYPKELRDNFEQDLDSLYDFQQFLKTPDLTADEIALYSTENLGKSLIGTMVVEEDVMKRMQDLLDWALPIKDLMNPIHYFSKQPHDLGSATKKEEFLEEVRQYLRFKSVPIIELIEPQIVNEEDDKN